jgi:hypothetical protein
VPLGTRVSFTSDGEIAKDSYITKLIEDQKKSEADGATKVEAERTRPKTKRQIEVDLTSQYGTSSRHILRILQRYNIKHADFNVQLNADGSVVVKDLKLSSSNDNCSKEIREYVGKLTYNKDEGPTVLTGINFDITQ